MDAESMKATIHPDGTFKPYEPPKTQSNSILFLFLSFFLSLWLIKAMHAGVVGKAAKEENVLEINLDEERRNQELLNNGNNNNNDCTEGTGLPIVLAPIRIERTSDDENDDDDDNDKAAANDEEREYVSKRKTPPFCFLLFAFCFLLKSIYSLFLFCVNIRMSSRKK